MATKNLSHAVPCIKKSFINPRELDINPKTDHYFVSFRDDHDVVLFYEPLLSVHMYATLVHVLRETSVMVRDSRTGDKMDPQPTYEQTIKLFCKVSGACHPWDWCVQPQKKRRCCDDASNTSFCSKEQMDEKNQHHHVLPLINQTWRGRKPIESTSVDCFSSQGSCGTFLGSRGI